jgi:hypothetical protein
MWIKKLRLKTAIYGLRTILGLGRRGYFIPYRYAQNLDLSDQYYPSVANKFSDLCDPQFVKVLTDIARYRDELENIGGDPPAPRWKQDWFPGLDGAATYALVRETQPRRVLEIGSGHSTRFIVRAKQDGRLATEITCIDPAPRADLRGLDLDLRLMPIQHVDLATLPQLEPGDILFVDSSHIAMPGSDVDWIVNHLIPVLPKGVLVHFHDIFLPDGYPANWEWRGYNEQIVVAALLSGGRAVPLFSSQYIRRHRPDLIDSLNLGWIPRVDGAIESSIWLEIR